MRSNILVTLLVLLSIVLFSGCDSSGGSGDEASGSGSVGLVTSGTTRVDCADIDNVDDGCTVALSSISSVSRVPALGVTVITVDDTVSAGEFVYTSAAITNVTEEPRTVFVSYGFDIQCSDGNELQLDGAYEGGGTGPLDLAPGETFVDSVGNLPCPAMTPGPHTLTVTVWDEYPTTISDSAVVNFTLVE